MLLYLSHHQNTKNNTKLRRECRDARKKGTKNENDITKKQLIEQATKNPIKKMCPGKSNKLAGRTTQTNIFSSQQWTFHHHQQNNNAQFLHKTNLDEILQQTNVPKSYTTFMTQLTNPISPIVKNAMDAHFYEIWPWLTHFGPLLANNLALYKPAENPTRTCTFNHSNEHKSNSIQKHSQNIVFSFLE